MQQFDSGFNRNIFEAHSKLFKQYKKISDNVPLQCPKQFTKMLNVQTLESIYSFSKRCENTFAFQHN